MPLNIGHLATYGLEGMESEKIGVLFILAVFLYIVCFK